MESKTKKAMFGAGCFWHSEEAFREVEGVVKTEVGYSGGEMENPTYEDVCWNDTGHIEIVRIEYESEEVSYKKLLKVFWEIHDSTSWDRQGADIGSQYRSVIFYFDEKQKREAEESLKNEQEKHKRKVVTEIRKAEKFFKAEKYHQKYLMKRGKKIC